jgi:hypothetical protein
VGDGVIVRRVQRRLQGGYVIVCDDLTVAPENIDRLRIRMQLQKKK